MSDNSLTPPKSIRARSSQRSIIRELLKLASQPDVISFAGGLPSPKSFPVKAIEKATDWVLETQGTRALQYSSTEGEPALRKAIAAHEAELGAPVDPACIFTGTRKYPFSGRELARRGWYSGSTHRKAP